MKKNGMELRWSVHNSDGSVVEKGEGTIHREINYLAFKFSTLGRFLDWIQDIDGVTVKVEN